PTAAARGPSSPAAPTARRCRSCWSGNNVSPMGEMVEFPSNGGTGQGYLAAPEVGAGIGLVVIQEWWGLVPHIKDVCDRFAAEGFTALAPDLFHGETTKSPDEAGKLMMALRVDEAEKDLRGAI